jgi:hypothetical protein
MNDNEIRELEGHYVELSEMDAGYTGAEMGRGTAVTGIRRKPVGSPDLGVCRKRFPSLDLGSQTPRAATW